MKKALAVITAFIVVTSLGTFAANGAAGTNSELKKRLVECGSIPNGSFLTVVETTRSSINLPRDYFPNIKLKVISHGATAQPFSNGGTYGYGIGAQGKPNCWSYALEFELSPANKSHAGTISLGSNNAYKNLSNYYIHFKVVDSPPSATRQVAGNGTVYGQVLLGPTCPVEKIPPDPACAPRAYKSTLNIWSTFTGSNYQPVATDTSGKFTLSLAPGSYSLKVSSPANGSLFPRCGELSFVVRAKRSQNITVNCDTGIR